MTKRPSNGNTYKCLNNSILPAFAIQLHADIVFTFAENEHLKKQEMMYKLQCWLIFFHNSSINDH